MIFLCALDALPEGETRGFEFDDISVFALRRNGVVYAYRNSCPHLGVELNWREDEFLDADGGLLQCATHGALFIAETGECVAGPCLGKHLQALATQVEHGAISIQL
ncbi:MAG: (2Fe-2S)-binding protein [Verrucomicrobiaceae bacterium]|nr:(2Fe-2S)-binding protein [Verrucomicrobiaceae bacterium]